MESAQIVETTRSVTAELFSTMIGLDLEALPTRIDHSNPSRDDGVMAIVGITGPWVGSGIISCSTNFACRLAEAFLMTEAPSVNEEVLDTVGELANIIIGNVKTAAEGIVGPLALTVPTVISGRSFMSKTLRNNDWTVMPFKSGEDLFEIRMWLVPAR